MIDEQLISTDGVVEELAVKMGSTRDGRKAALLRRDVARKPRNEGKGENQG